MDDQAFDENASSPSEWLLDQELNIAAEVYGPKHISLHTPVDELSDTELIEHFMKINNFDVHFE
jgi:hypothetical protein